MGFVIAFSATVCALLIGWTGQVGAIFTNGGNADGAPCVFPFTYNGVEYNECISANWDDSWCATTNNYDNDGIWGKCSPPQAAGALSNGYEVYTKNGDKCVFPFNAFGKTFNNCTIEYVTVKEPWCSLTSDYDKDRKMGYCDFTRTSACGDFDKLENKFAYDGVEVVAAKLEDCKKSCLDNMTCLGFDFNNRAKCYLHFDETSFKDVYSGDGVDHYIRQVCTTTAAPTTATMPVTSTESGGDTCEDSFEVMNNTMAFGGESMAEARSLNACREACLSFNNETDKYCLAFDYNDKAGIWCYLHFDSKNLETLYDTDGIVHYKRVKCIPPPVTDCEDEFNKTENRLSYDGKPKATLLTVDDCKKGCLANNKCLAFDYDDTAVVKCYHHVDAAYKDNANSNAQGVDQYVRVEVECPDATTGTTMPTTTKPRKTTRPVVTTTKPGCVDTFTDTKDQLSFGGKKLVNASTVDGCKAACVKDADCVGFDYDISLKECFSHDDDSFKFIAPAKGVNQYTRVKCVEPTTVPTTPKPTTGAPSSTTSSPVCVKEFVESVDKHAFGGKLEKGAVTLVACKQLCLATTGCKGLDFNSEDNSCWLLDSSNIEPLGDGDNIKNFKLTENCRATRLPTSPAATTMQPICKDTYTEMKNKHGFGGTECPSAKTLDSCKEACTTNTSCVAIDFVANKSECWIHMVDKDKPVTIGDAVGINHYQLVRCARDPTFIVTTPTVPTTTECVESFSEVAGKHALNGVEVAIADTLEKCKESCRGNDQCLAIDFNDGEKGCWIHVDAKKLETLNDITGVNHYKLERRCASTGTTTTVLPAECVADIAMVVDSSGSIRDANVAGRKDNYDFVKEFLSMMVGRMSIGPMETRVAAVTFSNEAQVRFPLNKYTSLGPLQTGLLDLPYSGGKTNTPAALRLARTEVFKKENGDRLDVKNIIVLITDGNTTVEVGNLKAEVLSVKAAKITVFGIGVTDGINRNELKNMVSEPVDKHFFTVDDFNQLIGVLENVILGTCAQQTTPSARR